MKHNISQIASILDGTTELPSPDLIVEYVVTDSRRVLYPGLSIFVALVGERHNGHSYIAPLYHQGVRNFIISEDISYDEFKEANFIRTTSTLQALQDLAAWHRSAFKYPVIGITGSNGKTIIKEWLYQVLKNEFSVIRSPRSFNSQLGVPLSALKMGDEHDLGIFEAGISRVKEMSKLENILRPDIGILTHIGAAHDEGFGSRSQKLHEKLSLFTGTSALVLNSDDPDLESMQQWFDKHKRTKRICWTSNETNCFVSGVSFENFEKGTLISYIFESKRHQFKLPFHDRASLENCMIVLCTTLYLGFLPEVIHRRLAQLRPVEMRMETKRGVRNNYIINDSYSADLDSLAIALDFMHNQDKKNGRVAILSDLVETGLSDREMIRALLKHLEGSGVDTLLGVGSKLFKNKQHLQHTEIGNVRMFKTTDNLLGSGVLDTLANNLVLIKGARKHQFERIAARLEEKSHSTVLEVDMDALAGNLNVYRQMIPDGVRMMAMVKAFSYGSGSSEVARLMENRKVDYLAVAYTDEGVRLRNEGIGLPIMVMNAEMASFEKLVEYDLEPELYSLNQLQDWTDFIKYRNLGENIYPVHIKLDTGMHRLGFSEQDLPNLISSLNGNPFIQIRSIFSHLSGSEDVAHDQFSRHQIHIFRIMSQRVINSVYTSADHTFWRHIANTSAIARFPEALFDMVRVGIGLYGIDPSGLIQHKLAPVARLKTRISQIKVLGAGDTFSYGRSGRLDRPGKIATINIGYADGIMRRLGNGNASFSINGHLYPTAGNICMDMSMLDIGFNNNIVEGDEVCIFGDDPTLEQLAEWAGTIPYEIISGISQRVRRIYISE